MSSSKFVKTGNQLEIKEILQKKKDRQVKVTPTTSKPSTKKQTPPSSERPNSKKHHHTVVGMEPDPASTNNIKKQTREMGTNILMLD